MVAVHQVQDGTDMAHERAVTSVTVVQESPGSSVGGRFAEDGTLFTSRSYSRSMSGLESMKSAVARLQAIGTL